MFKLVGHLVEEDGGFKTYLMRQIFRTHRSFVAHVLDTNGEPLLTMRRPMYLVNSAISVHEPRTDAMIGVPN